jgi:hypothetical protein
VFSFARTNQLWLAAALVKAPDELAALGLDGRLASLKSPDYPAKENIRYELTQPQTLLTSTGLLMEGRGTHGALKCAQGSDHEVCSRQTARTRNDCLNRTEIRSAMTVGRIGERA